MIAETALILLLARTCVAEIGFVEDTDECVLMWAINERHATDKGRSIENQTRLFNSYWKVSEHQKRRPYIKHMDGMEKPKGWPKTLDWSNYVHKWAGIRRAAQYFVSNPRVGDYICPEAYDYGGYGDHPRSPGMVRVKCLGGRTKQRYWGHRREVVKNGKRRKN